MAQTQILGHFTTLGAKKQTTWHFELEGGLYSGPVVVMPNFGEYQWGELEVGNISVTFALGDVVTNPYFPGSWQFHVTITNKSDVPVSYNLNIGSF